MQKVNHPHVHADMIKAWADGKTIEFLDGHSNKWKTILPGQTVGWYDYIQYRIKKADPIEIHYRTLAYWEDIGKIGFITVTNQQVADDWESDNPRFIRWVDGWKTFSYET